MLSVIYIIYEHNNFFLTFTSYNLNITNSKPGGCLSQIYHIFYKLQLTCIHLSNFTSPSIVETDSLSCKIAHKQHTAAVLRASADCPTFQDKFGRMISKNITHDKLKNT